jgi:SAM-dependent methyltransferase
MPDLYDAFSTDYDRFVNWGSRLEYEMPFILDVLREAGVHSGGRVLDAACGTGHHTLALAAKGYQAAGSDLSEGMIRQACANAAAMSLPAPFKVAGFEALADIYSISPLHPFDALLCLGNSLPHISDERALARALSNFAKCLRPGGLLLLQNRNFDAVMAGCQRFMEPQTHRDGDHEWLFVRFYDFLPDGMIDFHVLTLHRASRDETWLQHEGSTPLLPLLQADLERALSTAGFEQIRLYGSMDGAPFDLETSGNLVISARRKSKT